MLGRCSVSAKREPLGAWEPLSKEELLCGKYKIGRILGAGAMGIVYYAEHVQLRIPVAIKVLRVELSGAWNGVERMLREARAAARLKSEHVVRVLDVGRLDDGLPFIVMEYLDGSDLARSMHHEGRFSLYDAIDYVVQACDGISEAHAAGIVHRDLKPENLFLTKRGDGSSLVKVFDFGVSKEIDANALRVTEVASAVGSPAYMSPEQMRAEEHIDCRTDIWSLGVVLTELCTGQLPYSAPSLSLLFEAVQSSPPRLPRSYDASLPKEIDDIVRRCLQPKAEARFASASELAAALVQVLESLPSSSRVQLRRFRSSISTRSPGKSSAPPLSSRKRLATLTSAGVLSSVAVLGVAFVAFPGEPRQADAANPMSVLSVNPPSPLPLDAEGESVALHEPVRPAQPSVEQASPIATVSAAVPVASPPKQRQPLRSLAPALRSQLQNHEDNTAAAAWSERPVPAPGTADVRELELERGDDAAPRANARLEPWDPESFGGRR
jgi:serine/threonine protein kinase